MKAVIALSLLFAIVAAVVIPSDADYVLTPAGYRHRSCVHGVSLDQVLFKPLLD